MYGDDWRYARTRLQGSVVTWKDELVQVEEVYEHIVTFVVVSKAGLQRQECHLRELDVKPLKLGYVNYQGVASYLCRAPVRKDWKQGIRLATMRTLNGRDPSKLPFKCINNTHRGEFPKLSTCIKIIGGKPGSIAWARDWAVDHEGGILYRGDRVVGKIVDNLPLLNPQYIYLKENLEASYEKG